ncbi:MAG: hypothetical protein V7637_5509 [Mycobacteriales bacterium]
MLDGAGWHPAAWREPAARQAHIVFVTPHDPAGADDVSDGFILVPHITPGGLDGFVDTVVPILRERGVLRAGYTGTTLRDHRGLSAP